MNAATPKEAIEVFGRHDCADTLRTRAALDRLGAVYLFHDVDADPAVAAHAAQIGGSARVPVVLFPDGSVAVEPTDDEILAALDNL